MVSLLSSKSFRTFAKWLLCKRYDALLSKLSAGPSLARKAEKPLRSNEFVGDIRTKIVQRLFGSIAFREDNLHTWSSAAG